MRKKIGWHAWQNSEQNLQTAAADLTNQVAFIDTRQRVTRFGTSRNHGRLVDLTLQNAVQANHWNESRKIRLAAQIY